MGALCGGSGGRLIVGESVNFRLQRIDSNIPIIAAEPVAVDVGGRGVLPIELDDSDYAWSVHLCKIAWWIGVAGASTPRTQPAVIAPGIYLGGRSEAADVATLQSLGIGS